ncbi:MAG: radical SAM protein [Candidatus Omnitrophota bacterium]
MLALTYRCQCRCIHCSVGGYQLGSEELNIEEWKNVIDRLERIGTPRIHISGGEPTIKDGFIEIIRYASSKGFLVFLETNGYSLNMATIQRLKKAGVSSIDISLDSVYPKVHDKKRGLDGIFEGAIRAIKICNISKIPYMISTYATRENIYSGELLEMIYYAKRMRVPAIRILESRSSGRWLNNLDICLKEKDKSYLREKYPIYAILDRSEFCYCPIQVKFTIFIAPDGELQPCSHLPFSFGNIRVISIEESLDRMSKSLFFKERSKCYVNDPNFRNEFLTPALSGHVRLPVSI